MEQQQKGSKAYLFSIVMVAVLGGLLFGYDTAVISGAEKGLQAFFKGAGDFEYTDVMHGFTSSSALIGCIIGSSLSGLFASRLGRKRSLIFAGVCFFLSAWGSMEPETYLLPQGHADWTLLVVFNFYRVLGGIGAFKHDLAVKLHSIRRAAQQLCAQFADLFPQLHGALLSGLAGDISCAGSIGA